LSPEILREIDETGSIATVTLSNPDKLNAVTAAMWRELARVLNLLHDDDALRCIVIRGAGSTFAAGGDIEEFLRLRDTHEQALEYHGTWVADALRSISACRHPCVAMIEGPCIGGGLEIAGQCDLRIAGESASFGAPIMRLGFSMAPIEMSGLLAFAGPATTLEILLEGRLLTAHEAYAKGLLTRVVADDRVEQEAYATALRIAAGAPLVARRHKRLVRRLAGDSSPLSVAEVRESYAYLDSEDYREGLAAFLAKRPARFRGR